MDMVTDPGRVRATDPGRPEVCSAFHYREVFDGENAEQVAETCRSGSVGCTTCKGALADVLNDFIAPFRERRKEFEARPEMVRDILNSGGARARIAGQRTLEKVKDWVKESRVSFGVLRDSKNPEIKKDVHALLQWMDTLDQSVVKGFDELKQGGRCEV